MTAQICDRIEYSDTSYNVAGVNGSGLFNPEEHGVTPMSFSTACWRGYHCDYAVANNTLRLRAVYLGLEMKDAQKAKLGKGPLLYGNVPSRYKIRGESVNVRTGEVSHEWDSSDYRCDGLDELVPFTGGLLIGDQFIRELYVHMGFHPAYKYKTVHELVFEAGHLAKATDCSDKMAEFRAMLKDRELQPDPRTDRKEVIAWIEQCFSLDYHM